MIILAFTFIWLSGCAFGAGIVLYFIADSYYKRLKLIHKEASTHFNDTRMLLIKKLTGL